MQFTSKQFRHISTGEIVHQVPISRFGEYEEVVECETIFDGVRNWRILCEVSGGITGYNQAYLKADGEECEFTEDEARIRANELTATMNKPHSRATFKYTPELA
jgi:hypothetical protein